jgi:hypothetical protein
VNEDSVNEEEDYLPQFKCSETEYTKI